MTAEIIYSDYVDSNVSVEDVGIETVLEEVAQDEVDVTESVTHDSGRVSHADLADRELPGQHTIASIAGLREELDNLEFSYSNVSGKGYAQYHLWADGGPSSVSDRIGCFVSATEDGSGSIKVCTSADDDVFGVIVSRQEAGYVGNSIEQAEDAKYGLVCLLGTVQVKAAQGVKAGDYVVPNALGFAEVVSVTTERSFTETITITDSALYCLEHTPIRAPEIYEIDDKGEIIGVVNVGESAEGKVVTVDKSIIGVCVEEGGYSTGNRLRVIYTYNNQEGLGYKVMSTHYKPGANYVTINLIPNGNALHRIQSEIGKALDRLSVAENNIVVAVNRANEAYVIADTASGNVSSELIDRIEQTENAANNAQDTANKTQSFLNGISDSQAELLENFNDFEEQTKKDIEENVKEIESLWTENGNISEATKSLFGKVSKYAVGIYSQANGLKLESAQSIIPSGTLYVPTLDHTEFYQYNEENASQTFSRDYSYTWNGNEWDRSTYANVSFSGEYVSGSTTMLYWYTESEKDVANGSITYPKNTLYEWRSGEWIAIATLEDNTLSRAVSFVQQTENEIKNEITNVRGDYAEISARVDANEVAVQSITKLEESLTVVEQKSDQNAASITQLAQFGYEIKSSKKLDNTPTDGPFYAEKPEWKDDAWVFAGATYDDLGNVDDVEYCYAENTEDSKTYYQYNCGADNQWTEIKIGRSEYLAGIQQKADNNEASVAMIVEGIGKDGKVDAASIVAKVNDAGSSLQFNANNINFDSGDYVIKSQHLEIDASEININGDELTFSAGTFGGRNLLLGSGNAVSNSNNLIQTYYLSAAPVVGKQYTLTLKGTLGEGRECFDIFNSGDSVILAELKQVETSDIYTATFEWKNSNDTITVDPTYVNVYVRSISVETESTIEWIKLESGRVSTDWTPAPEDQVSANQTSTQMNWKMLPEKCVWWNDVSGTDSEDTPLMRLDDKGLMIRGQVEATSGHIAEYEINGHALYSKKVTNVAERSGLMSGIYTGSGYTDSGDSIPGTHSISISSLLDGSIEFTPVRFFAGAPFVNPDDNGQNGEENFVYGKFVVLEDGSLYTSAIQANGGYIGSWRLGTVPNSIGVASDNTELTGALYSSAGLNTTILRASSNQNDWSMVNLARQSDGTYKEVFGVKHNGHLLATSGQIGQFEIKDGKMNISADQISFSSGDVGGRNLLYNTSSPRTCTSPSTSTHAYNVYQITTAPLDTSKRCVFSADVQFLTGSSDYITINFCADPYEGPYYQNEHLKITNGHISWVGKLPSSYKSINNVLVYAGKAGETNNNSVVFSNVKLEVGTVPTAWTPAPEDQVPTNQTSTKMNWKMTPDGCYWWNNINGTDTKENPLMKLDSTGLFVKGQIEATSGKIGTWKLGTVPKAYINTPNSTGVTAFTDALFSTTFADPKNNAGVAGNTTILRASNASTDWAFVNIKKNDDDTYEEVFGIKHDGSLKAKNFSIDKDGNAFFRGRIEATKGTFTGELHSEYGEIGGLLIQNNGIYSNNSLLSFSSDGNITAKNINITEDMSVTKLSSTLSNGASLSFDEEPESTEQVKFTVTYNIDRSGTKTIGGDVYDTGMMSFTVNAVPSVTKKTKFAIKVNYYNSLMNRTYTNTVQCSINKGSSKGTATTYHMVSRQDSDMLIPLAFEFNSYSTQLYISDSEKITIYDTYYHTQPTIGSGQIICRGNFVPGVESGTKNSVYSLGTDANRWDVAYFKTGYSINDVIITSDANKKNTIEPIGEKYSALFDSLFPVTFKLNEGESDRTHIGLIAQELKNSMDVCGIDSQELAAYCRWEDSDGAETYGIRYGEFISLCIYEIQKLKRLVPSLEEKVQALEAKIQMLGTGGQDISDDIEPDDGTHIAEYN